MMTTRVDDEASQHARPKVFVSHSHKNDKFTKRFVADLRAAGVEVWVDMTNIRSGDFVGHISEGLKTCEWLIVVLTPEALASEFVPWEVNIGVAMAVQKEIKGVIPFMVHPCDPKTIPRAWITLHRYDATSDYKSALAGLLRALGLE